MKSCRSRIAVCSCDMHTVEVMASDKLLDQISAPAFSVQGSDHHTVESTYLYCNILKNCCSSACPVLHKLGLRNELLHPAGERALPSLSRGRVSAKTGFSCRVATFFLSVRKVRNVTQILLAVSLQRFKDFFSLFYLLLIY